MDLMIFTTDILKEVKVMRNNELANNSISNTSLKDGDNIDSFYKLPRKKNRTSHPFYVILHKEISDHVRSWRFIILLIIISLTCFGSIYTAISSMGTAARPDDPDNAFFFLRIFTQTDGTLPSFVVFIGFLGPLLGISLGFDAVNSEHNSGTLSRILAHPVHRDYILNAKFLGALYVISIMFFSLGLLVIGFGLITIGIPPTVEEFLRIIIFLLISIVYVSFWLNLSIMFSVRFRQPATSALAAIAIWLFFTIFYGLIINLITKPLTPGTLATQQQLLAFQHFKLNLMRIMPNQLFSEATTTLLMPSVRSLGPLSVEKLYGSLPGPLPLGQSVLLVWPQVTSLIAGTIICFLLAYVPFMRREIRSR
jgi:ABC-2 type transport system permease protein